MVPKQEDAQPAAHVNPFFVFIMIGLAFASGYMAARSVVFNPNGFMTVAQVQLGGAIVAVVLISAAFGLSGKLVRASKKSNR